MRLLLGVLYIMLAIAPVRAEYWVPANQGMSGWSFTDIVIDQSNPQVIYAVGMSGVYKTSNGGTSWAAVNNGLAPTPYTFDIEIHPSNPQTLYIVSQFAEGGRGVYKSTDGGASWQRKSNGIYLPYINSISIFKSDPRIIFAGTNVGGAKGGVFKSLDAGETWTLVAGDDVPGSNMGNDAAPIVVDPNDSSYVFCGKNSYTGFSRSSNGGASWTWTDYSLIVTDIVIHPVETNRIYVGGRNLLKMSIDRGLSLPKVCVNLPVGGIAVAPSNTDVIYAGPVGAPIYKSVDRGNTWTQVGTEAHQFTALAVHPSNPDTIYATTSGEGILKSTNGGFSWSAINGGLPTQMRCTKIVSSLKYKAIWAIIDTRAIYVSYDDGNSWIQLAAISGYPGDLEIWEGDEKTLYMANTDVYVSRDLGVTWTPMVISAGHSFTQIGIDPRDANRMFVYDDTDKKLKRTTDGGKNWESVATITAHLPYWSNIGVTDIAVDASNSQRIYLGTMNHPWKSEDGGNTWTILTGLEYNVLYGGVLKPTSFIRDIAIDPVQPNIVYATTQWGYTWKSTNYGETWTMLSGFPSEANIHNNVVFDPRDHNTIYISTIDNGVFKSTTGGGSWSQLISGLSGADRSIYRLVMSPWNYDHILGGSYAQGVYIGGGMPDVPTLARAKGEIPDGGVYTFTSPQVVSGIMPDGAIYVQSEHRSEGIRVLGADGFRVGDRVRIRGVMGTDNGERSISVLEAVTTGSGPAPEPLGMTNASIGGRGFGLYYPQIDGASGLCNTGLLIRAWGRITSVLDANHFYVADGSLGPLDVLVEAPMASRPSVGDLVIVTGESGSILRGGVISRLIRARSSGDVVVIAEVIWK